MANICLDVMPLTHIVNSTGWYAVLKADIEDRNVLVWLAGGQYKKEIEGNNKIKAWLVRLAEAGKARSVDSNKFDVALKEIRVDRASKCKECDDPHLFSLCMVAGAQYLFTEDKRLSKCRTKMNKSAPLRKFCKIRFIYKQQEYQANRTRILT